LLLLEDHGNVIARHRPPRWCPVLLRILASGDASKERIVAGLWGLRAYHPDLHDPPVRTTIHRLRAFLQPHVNWIEVSEAGYRTPVAAHLGRGPGGPGAEGPPLWEEGEVPALDARSESLAPRGEVAGLGPLQLVFQRLAELEQATVRELASSLELS